MKVLGSICTFSPSSCSARILKAIVGFFFFVGFFPVGELF